MNTQDFIPTAEQKFLLKFFMIDYVLKHSDTPEGAAYRNEKPENIQEWLREFPRPYDRQEFINKGYEVLRKADYEGDEEDFDPCVVNYISVFTGTDTSLRWKHAWAILDRQWDFAHMQEDDREHTLYGFPKAGWMSPSQAWGFLEFLGIDPKERWHIVYDEEQPCMYWMSFEEKDNWETVSAPVDSEWWQQFQTATREYEVLKAAFDYHDE